MQLESIKSITDRFNPAEQTKEYYIPELEEAIIWNRIFALRAGKKVSL